MSDTTNTSQPAHTDGRARTVVVFTGGDAVGERADLAIEQATADGSFVIAADSGLHHARARGCRVDLVVGDFDSVEPSVLTDSQVRGARAVRYPAAKDATDLELAMTHAMELAPEHVIVIGGYGGRLDHFLANVALLGSARFAPARVEAHFDEGSVHVVRDELVVGGEPGQLITLLPANGPAWGVRTDGLRYPLHGETLESGSSRGVSNEFVEERATVALDRGVLLAVIPSTTPAGAGRPDASTEPT